MNAPETRERTRGGISAPWSTPARMSSHISPTPEMNSAAKRKAITSQCGPRAAGTRSSGAGKRKQPIRNAGPTPIARAIRPVSDDATSVPAAATPSTTPIVAGATRR